MKKLLFLAALVLLAWACAFFVLQGEGFTRFWKEYLIVSVPMTHADALIVPGGEPLARPQKAARLYNQGVAPRIFVTGIGDSGAIRKVLLGQGVPPSAITVESKARTTHANAILLKPMIEAAKVHSALIVTSPFHTRRALATFRTVMPGINFGVTEASIEWWAVPEGRVDVNRFAAVEFLKTAEYWLLYGVSPLLLKAPKVEKG
jgi:uncharacterized SAM-binding protein YcdF (DUF218 family)